MMIKQRMLKSLTILGAVGITGWMFVRLLPEIRRYARMKQM